MAAFLNPLAIPKGSQPRCELCGKTARVYCSICKAVYYCSEEHYDLDHQSIHSLVCNHLFSLEQTPTDQTIRSEIIETCKREAMTLLSSHNYSFAIPPSLHTLNHSVSLHGQTSIHLVPAYLLLAESSIGLERYGYAKEYLSLASWILMQQETETDQSPESSESNQFSIVITELRSRIFLLFGRLYFNQNNLSKSSQHFAKSLYYFSCRFGIDHYLTCLPLYYIGICVGKQEVFFQRVLEILNGFLNNSTNLNLIDIIGETQFSELENALNDICDYYLELNEELHLLSKNLLDLLYQ
ncbi:hypothetical protein P9112_003893 [Eukaryota sp. TZLM1-RC]